jgi:phosphoribosylaminoimidazole carboxylase (NCAIR synthetase)
MFDKQNVQRDKIREEIAALREAAIAKLERHGYDVRGKTPAQIRRALKRRPRKTPATTIE